MEIKRIVVGPLETNAYIIYKEKKAIIIDPGDEADKIIETIANFKVVGIIITHYHFDHIGALEEIFSYTKSEIYDRQNMKEGHIKIDNFDFECIYTPGHKEDAISLYFEEEKILFSGDFIFRGTIGRWDLPGGDFHAMKKSIEHILTCVGDCTIYPGHGLPTTLETEREMLKMYKNTF